MVAVLHICRPGAASEAWAARIGRFCGLEVSTLDGEDIAAVLDRLPPTVESVILMYNGEETDSVAKAHACLDAPNPGPRRYSMLGYGLAGPKVVGPTSKRLLQFCGGIRPCVLDGATLAVPEDGPASVLPGIGTGDRVLVKLNGQPLLCASVLPNGHHLRMAALPVVDLDLRVPSVDFERGIVLGVLPFAYALRELAGDACWHNPFPAACVIIDDPLVRPRYGFFDYGEVLAELEGGKYSTTVAFIPCNHARSDLRTAQVIGSHRDRMSLCVHGCFHNEAEFADPDPKVLGSRAAMALELMRAHETTTGLPFDLTMVFPQGAFSSAALAQLQASGYLAAVNSTIHPRNLDADPVRVIDLFALAHLGFSDVPLFRRRYPHNIEDFVVDCFLGKPVLIVEHHGYYRSGAVRMTQFVSRLRTALPGLEWLTLDRALIQSALYRRTGQAEYEVFFVTGLFRLRNPSPNASRFRCWKKESDPAEIRGVSVNGLPVAVRFEKGRLTVEVELSPSGEGLIEIHYQRTLPAIHPPAPLMRAKIFVRRRLSEFRDNHLSHNEHIVALVRRAKNALFRWF